LVTFEGQRFEYQTACPGEHYRLIVEATREKVRQNPEVKKVLLATGNLVLNRTIIRSLTRRQPGAIRNPDADQG